MTTHSSNPNYLALVCGMVVGLMGLNTMPFMIGHAVEVMRLPTNVAGWLATAETAGVAIGSMLVPALVMRTHLRPLTLIGATIATLADFFSAGATDFTTFIALRTAAGLASGIVLGGVTIWIAGTGDPERTYGRVYMGMSSGFALLLVLLPAVQSRFGGSAMFLALGTMLCVLSALLVRQWHVGLYPQDHPTQKKPFAWGDALRLFASMTLAYFTYGAAYAFSEQIGETLGLSATAIGAILSAWMIASIVGSGVAGCIGLRWGRARPLCGVILLAGISYLLIMGAETSVMLLIGMVICGLTTMFYNAYSLGVAVALDPVSGRVASVLQGYSLIPYAFGPGIMGTLVSGAHFKSLAFPALAINLLAIVVVLPVLTRLDRESSGHMVRA
ncbi:MFS transporter [Paraburkholderia oxyphila]|uniref:MFS transporter n=1 Tax=Paraburkholderia oxyphila TaxID=614212 RepID=UPI000481FF36|nr:MFS transporter [Paraburkholderia oxyphila]